MSDVMFCWLFAVDWELEWGEGVCVLAWLGFDLFFSHLHIAYIAILYWWIIVKDLHDVAS